MTANSLLLKLLDLISLTWSSVSHHMCLLPVNARSRALDLAVPSYKCDGFTQARLLQVWHTKPLIGCFNDKLYLWARHCLFWNWNNPYPSLSLLPNQFQQESVLSTLEKNRSTGSTLRMITIIQNKSGEVK